MPGIDSAKGDATGLAMPAHPDALRAMGCGFLTQAFQEFGAMARDNRVLRVTRFEQCPGGSTGKKVLLSLEYARPEEGLYKDLFVKFSRDFDDPVRDGRGKFEMESEVHLAELSRLDAFPVAVPHVQFADFHSQSSTGLLITRCIPFGREGIEPHRPKCMDHEMAEPEEHYSAIFQALARIAGAHRSGRLDPYVEQYFPYDPDRAATGLHISFGPSELHAQIDSFRHFTERFPQLIPARVRTSEFIGELEEGLHHILERQAEIRRFLVNDPQFIGLCHWNANIDNAWFWRGQSGGLSCGLFDWGHVGQMNLAFPIWGSLSGAGIDTWDRHGDRLIEEFLSELEVSGGPHLDRELFGRHLIAYVAMMGVSYFMQSPSRILSRLPNVTQATGPFDPLFQESETARNQLRIMTNFLNLWACRKIGSTILTF